MQGGEVVQPGALITERDEPGRTVRMHRDPNTGQATPVTEIHPQVCGECIAAIAREIGFSDAALIAAERDAERKRADEAEDKLHKAELELHETKAGYGAAQQFSKILRIEQEHAAKKAAKPTTKEVVA